MDTIYIESCDAGGWLDPLQFVTALNDFGDDNELIESLALPTSQPEINFGKILTHKEECGRHNDITRVFSIVPFCDNLKKIHFIGGIRNGDKMLTNDKELHQKRFWSFFARYANKVYTEADGVMDIKEWFDKWQKLLQDYTLPYIKVISQEDFKAQFDLQVLGNWAFMPSRWGILIGAVVSLKKTQAPGVENNTNVRETLHSKSPFFLDIESNISELQIGVRLQFKGRARNRLKTRYGRSQLPRYFDLGHFLLLTLLECFIELFILKKSNIYACPDWVIFWRSI